MSPGLIETFSKEHHNICFHREIKKKISPKKISPIFFVVLVIVSVWRDCEQYDRPPDKSAYCKTIFFIPHPKHVVGTQKNRLNESSFERSKHMFELMGKKIITILR